MMTGLFVRHAFIVANTNYFLTDFVLERLKGCETVQVVSHEQPSRGWLGTVKKSMESVLPSRGEVSWIFPRTYMAQLQAIRPEDAVLMFGVENIKELRIIFKHVRAQRRTVFLWNPVRDNQQQHPSRLARRVRALNRLNAVIATFDPGDAQAYDFQLVEQVYRDASPWIKPQEVQDIDLYFVGQDKGRLPELQRLRDVALCTGLTVHFHITPDKRKSYTTAERSLLSEKPLTYSENLQLVNRSRCLVEVVQANQSGQTIRSLEAAFFDRKLLTNRQQAVREALYAADRVLTDAMPSSDALRRFVRAEHRPVDRDMLRRHDVLYWIRQFDS